MSKEINVAIVGVGNCASSLVQGIEYYKKNDVEDGLLTDEIGGYRPEDLNIVCGFDVEDTKVGKDVSEAVYSETNNVPQRVKLPDLDAPVLRGPAMDGFQVLHDNDAGGPTMQFSMTEPDDIAGQLEDYDVDVVVNLLPSGSKQATAFYALEAIDAGCGFANCIPVDIASSREWHKKFEEAALPVVGDDIKSQLGATILHRTLAQLFKDRGLDITGTYQLNVGGNTDFLNLLDGDESRIEGKNETKTESVRGLADGDIDDDEDVHISPSAYVGYLEDEKWAHFHVEGEGFLGAPVQVDAKLQVEDSANSGAISMDAIRSVATAMDRGIAGHAQIPSAWLMKNPPENVPDELAQSEFDSWR